MAQSNKIGLVGMAALKFVQDNMCSHCGHELDKAYPYQFAHGSIMITDAENYRTSVAHIVAASKGGKDTLENYTLQHYFCNRMFFNFDYAEFARVSGSVLSFEQVCENAKLAARLNVEVIKGKANHKGIADHARQLLAESSEWTRRTSDKLRSQLLAA